MFQSLALPFTAVGQGRGARSPHAHHTALEDRQISTIRFVGCFGVVDLACYILYNLYRWDFEVDAVLLKFLTVQATGVALFLGAVLVARRFPRGASWLLIVTICILCMLLTCLGGLRGGSHRFLLLVGPLAALIFDARRPYPVIVCCTLASVLHLTLEFVIPIRTDPYLPWLTLIVGPFLYPVDLSDERLGYALDIIFIEFGLGLCTYFAMRWARLAEIALTREYARSELLLQNLLPASIAARLKDNPSAIIADDFDMISILFADVVNFTPASAARRPQEVIEFLGRLFGEFDDLAQKYGLEKIKTIGDCYMVAGGMPEKSEHHIQAMADMALEMIAASERLTSEFNDGMSIRIGLHVGPAMAGVIGQKKPYYDVWGDTINVASRLESSSVPGRIQITPEVRSILGSHYTFENRGPVEIKGKGVMDLYFLTGKSSEES